MKKITFLFCLASLSALGQAEKPKLVVGIVVDQMRQEYLYRFSSKFGEGGFKRLMTQGFMARNGHYNYVPTYTGPGHASIYTGSTPSVHGIIGNDWYDKELKQKVNCVEDSRFNIVGVAQGNGDVSPYRMLSSTVTDELKVSTQRRARVIGLSIKDRGAVLPAGHAADGAYWYDSNTGKFISSTYYKPGLPLWLDQFNNQNLADKYLAKTWTTLLPIEQYTESNPDDNTYETILKGKSRPVFPYNLAELRKVNENFELLTSTPFSNDLLTELTKAALAGEEMGVDNITDFLAVSYSATDYIGHAMGPNSIEIEDTYLRLDKNIEDLLNTLDKKIGIGQYIIFLTSDHGVAEVPKSLLDLKIPAGYFNTKKLETALYDYMNQYFPGVKIIEHISNQQIFLDHSKFAGNPKTSGIDLMVAIQLISRFLATVEGVNNVFTETTMPLSESLDNSEASMVARGFHSRSGDISFTLKSGWLTHGMTGTTHGSHYAYDTNVPMIFFGSGVKLGVSDTYHPITDIAPTLSILLGIKFPSGCTGQPISEAIAR